MARPRTYTHKRFVTRLRGLMERDEVGTNELIRLFGGAPNSWFYQGMTPRVANLVDLAQFFGTTTDYLLGLTDRPRARANGRAR